MFHKLPSPLFIVFSHKNTATGSEKTLSQVHTLIDVPRPFRNTD